MLLAKEAAENFLKTKSEPFALNVFLKWREIVGNHYADISTPYKVVKSSRGNVLVVQAKPGYGVMIQHESWNIIRLVNGYLEQEYFSQLKAIQETY